LVTWWSSSSPFTSELDIAELDTQSKGFFLELLTAVLFFGDVDDLDAGWPDSVGFEGTEQISCPHPFTAFFSSLPFNVSSDATTSSSFQADGIVEKSMSNDDSNDVTAWVSFAIPGLYGFKVLDKLSRSDTCRPSVIFSTVLVSSFHEEGSLELEFIEELENELLCGSDFDFVRDCDEVTSVVVVLVFKSRCPHDVAGGSVDLPELLFGGDSLDWLVVLVVPFLTVCLAETTAL
jgi:hypothetical protein